MSLESRVTKKFCDKIAKNLAKPIFVKVIFNFEKSSPIFKKLSKVIYCSKGPKSPNLVTLLESNLKHRVDKIEHESFWNKN
jgi:hypothetical protein